MEHTAVLLISYPIYEETHIRLNVENYVCVCVCCFLSISQNEIGKLKGCSEINLLGTRRTRQKANYIASVMLQFVS